MDTSIVEGCNRKINQNASILKLKPSSVYYFNEASFPLLLDDCVIRLIFAAQSFAANRYKIDHGLDKQGDRINRQKGRKAVRLAQNAQDLAAIRLSRNAVD